MKIVLGVSGGIAAYKACSLLRLYTEAGHDVTVVPTDAALHFVGAATWEALSGKPVSTTVWSDVAGVPHVRLGQHADLVVVAPATADLLARAAHGLADDLLTTALLTARCPVVLAPAMHTEMWEHPATQANVATLIGRGVHVIPPASGRLTGTDTGPGRLPEPEQLYAESLAVVAAEGASRHMGSEDLSGRHVLISAGGTREALDPVRFLGNRSSGKQGYALAEAAVSRGATVTLVSANVALPTPPGVQLVRVESARQLHHSITDLVTGADVVIMAAAVADFRPKEYVAAKIKKSHDGAADGSTVVLVRNPDILAGLTAARGAGRHPLIVGFAAETGDADGSVLDHAQAKLVRKGVDLLVANEVGESKTFGQDTNEVHLLRPGADPVHVPATDKLAIAHAVLDVIRDLLEG